MRYIRYLIFFLTVFFIISTYNVYKSNLSLQLSIEETEDKINNLKEKIFYYENYVSDFMDTYYYKITYYHTFGLGLKGEKILIFNDIKDISDNKQEHKTGNFNKWEKFLYEKIKYIIDN